MAEKKIQTSAGMETASETVARAKAQLERVNGGSTSGSSSTSRSNPVLEALTERLTQQGKGISTSSSSSLQDSINEAIAGVQTSGNLTRERLQSEREREVSFAQDRASATFTTALESRSGYGTQVAALKELTETTEKSVRDLDKRYQEAILANDAETASTIAGLRIQKLQFQVEQEQAFFSNLIGVANLQQQAIQNEIQNEQFWIKKKQEDDQFAQTMAQSELQFEKNYGIALQEVSLKEQQLEIERQKFNLSAQEYRDRKAALATEKTFANTRAIIANDIKNKLLTAGTDQKLTREQILNPVYMAEMAERTGFDGTTEELATVIQDAYKDVSADRGFMSKYLGAPTPLPYTSNAGLNAGIQAQNNLTRAQYDLDRGVTIQSPDSFWSNLFR